VEFAQNVCDVGLDCFFTDKQRFRDFSVGFSRSDLLQHFHLAVTQAIKRIIAFLESAPAHFLHQTRRDPRVEHRLLSGGTANSAAKRVWVNVLQQIRKRASSDRGKNVFILMVGSEHDNFRVREKSFDLARGFDTIHAGHQQIHQHHVGQEVLGVLDSFNAIASFANNFDVGDSGEVALEPKTHDNMVINDKDFDLFGHSLPPSTTIKPLSQTHPTLIQSQRLCA